MMTGRTLVAGLGNIFFGDDAFGVETVHQLSRRHLPSTVDVLDIGIRSYDLAFALMDGYETIILVDAIQRGERPGTVSLIDLDLTHNSSSEEGAIMNAHSLHPAAVVQMIRSTDVQPKRIHLVGCEPLDTDMRDDGRMELSECMRASIPQAIDLIESCILDTKRQEETEEVSPAATERR